MDYYTTRPTRWTVFQDCYKYRVKETDCLWFKSVCVPGSALMSITFLTQRYPLPLAWEMHFNTVYLSVRTLTDNTFFWRWSRVKRESLSDSMPSALNPSPPFLPLAACEKDMSALEAQVLVGFAAMPLRAELQPQWTAVTALLQVTQWVFTLVRAVMEIAFIHFDSYKLI